MTHQTNKPRALGPGRLIARATRGVRGSIRIPGDKSISHRALMLGGTAIGETTIHGLLEGEDVVATAAAMRAMGATISRGEDGIWRARGRGVGALVEPDGVLDLGNSGTSARLLLGLIAANPITAFMTGDASLRRRPMGRVITPLGRMGARFVTRDGGRMPLAITGCAAPLPIEYRLPVASAQVKSAILLAGLNTPGATSVIEALPTRDHSEKMLAHFGAAVAVTRNTDGSETITITGESELHGREVIVPGDPSSAAFPLVAALLTADSALTIANVGLNPRRAGLIKTLREMGADLAIADPREAAGEPVGDLIVKSSALTGVEVPPERAPSMIDEYPILAVAAAFARGRTVMRGLGELRVKESDRLGAVARGLQAAGVKLSVDGDDLTVEGGRPAGGAAIETNLDHRIAMAFLVMGLATGEAMTIDDGRPIDTSFPGFVDLMRGLGAVIEGPV